MGTWHRNSGLGRKRRYIKVTLGQPWSITNGLNVSEFMSDMGWNHYFNGQMKVRKEPQVLMEKFKRELLVIIFTVVFLHWEVLVLFHTLSNTS